MSLIYGYHINFVDEPALQCSLVSPHTEAKTLIVEATPRLPKFAITTEDLPHSLQEVCYSFHFPLAQSKGKAVEWMMQVKNVLSLVWFPDRRIIGYKKDDGYTPQRLRFWVYHTFLPLLFQIECIYQILHVGSVEVAGKPILFSAPSFGGKSTMTDYFIRHGHPMLSDDTLGIEQRDDDYYAIASYPFHRPYREPETLGAPVKIFSTEVKPIRAVYILNMVETAEEIKVSEIIGIEKFKSLYFSSFMAFPHLQEDRFKFSAQIAKKIPVYQITYPQDLSKLPEVYAAIITHELADQAKFFRTGR